MRLLFSSFGLLIEVGAINANMPLFKVLPIMTREFGSLEPACSACSIDEFVIAASPLEIIATPIVPAPNTRFTSKPYFW